MSSFSLSLSLSIKTKHSPFSNLHLSISTLMAVEARNLNLFRPQLLPPNRGFGNPMEGDANMYANQMGYGVPLLSGTTTAAPTYNSMFADSDSPKIAMKSDSGVTYNCNLPMHRKRSRDCMDMNPFASAYPCNNPITTPKSCGSFSFLGDDISLQIQQQQLDIDRLISLHLENVRLEMEEKRKRQARRIMEAIEAGTIKRLKAKEEEIAKMGKLNWALQERVKSLCIENQLWRDMAQSNEAAVNALRANLEQVLCEANEDETEATAAARTWVDEDVESSCSSNGAENNNGMWCKGCGKEESSVLLLPCRHLCVCTLCGSLVSICPVCKCTKNATVQVNLA